MQKKARRGPPPALAFGKVVHEIAQARVLARAKLSPAADFSAAGASSSFFRSAHTVFTGLSAGPLSKAGRRAQTHPWGTVRRPPHIDTALRKDRGPAADAAGPLLYGGTAKKHAHHPDG